MASDRRTFICTKCKRSKPMYEHASCKGRCEECEHYSRRYRYFKRAKKLRALKEERFDLVYSYLANHCCADCEENDLLVLEFDHIGGKEQGGVSQLIQKVEVPIEVVFNEIAKCEVVCSNCHKRRTAKRANWYKLRWISTRDLSALGSYYGVTGVDR